MPFQEQGSYISIREAVELCQRAYFNVAIFKNTVNTISTLCNTDIYFEGGNAQSRSFFEAWLKRIQIWQLKDQFFREIPRSGNWFAYRVDGKLDKTEALKLNQTYSSNAALELPLRYITLNVADLAAINSLSYDMPQYFRVLTPQQLQIMKKSKNPDDKEVIKNLNKSIKDYFDGGVTMAPVAIDLDQLHTVFYQKQDYEPFAVPMGFSVLDDINMKLEFKKTDMVLARTVEYIILLVTMGSKEETDGTGGLDPNSLAALRELFKKEQVGRVLVSDWTTKLDWAIPDLNKVFGPSKYETVNKDIADGLMDIFFGQEKFANMQAKLKMFVERLNNIQDLFINSFLGPEVKRIAQMMNFKTYPTPTFVKVSLDDPTQIQRIMTQLFQLGAITPKDVLDGLNNGELPDFEKVLENQEEFKNWKDDGLFQPVIAAPQQEEGATSGGKPQGMNGRPPGTSSPQTTKKVSPIGTKASEQKFSMSRLVDVIRAADKAKAEIKTGYKKKKKIKSFTDNDNEVVQSIAQVLFENEKMEDWSNKVNDYLKSPVETDFDKALEIEEISNEYEVSKDAAILLHHSRL